jgi:hypothetical protein
VRNTFCINNSNQIKPLGKWFMQNVHKAQQRVAYYHHTTQSIYLYAGKGYQKYEVFQTKANTAALTTATTYLIDHELPGECVPADGHMGEDMSFFYFFNKAHRP